MAACPGGCGADGTRKYYHECLEAHFSNVHPAAFYWLIHGKGFMTTAVLRHQLSLNHTHTHKRTHAHAQTQNNANNNKVREDSTTGTKDTTHS